MACVDALGKRFAGVLARNGLSCCRGRPATQGLNEAGTTS